MNFENWLTKGTEICLEIEDVLKFDSSEVCKGKKALNRSTKM
jgi:hypothetical protein